MWIARDLVGVLLVGGAIAATAPAQAGTARQQVVIVGASVSAGFADPTSKGSDGEVNRTFRLDVAFKMAWPRAVARIHNFGDLLMFKAPAQRGRRQVEAARKRRPDLLLGIDFLTWFGYGRGQSGAAAASVDPVRMQRLEQGLALLEGFRCPVVVGDFPDMSGASSHMLPARLIPNRATLQALNQRLAQWAKTRRNVHVFPLASFVKTAVSSEQVFPWGTGQRVRLPRNFLLQSDRLHATRVGALVVVLRVTQALPAILPKGHPLLRPGLSLRQLVTAARLEAELPAPLPVVGRDRREPGAQRDR